MASSGSCSDMKTYYEPCRHQDESQPESEARSSLLSGSSPASVASTHSGSRINSVIPSKYCIRDTNQQVLVLKGSVLIAVPDKLNKKGETFYVLTSSRLVAQNMKANPIFLAVSKGEFCLCCDKVREPRHPSLALKKKNIQKLNALKPEDALPFTFLKEQAGSYFTLESAANPGYFIYTYSTSSQPVGMTKEQGREKNTHFEFAGPVMDVNEVRD